MSCSRVGSNVDTPNKNNILFWLAVFTHHHNLPHEFKAMFVLAENDFRKSFYMKLCVWLRMENRVFRKIICFDRKIAPLTRKIFSAFVLPSNHFRRRAKRERTHRHTNKEKEREIAPLSSRLRWLDRHPCPLHATMRSRHEPINPPRPPARSRHEPTNWSPSSSPPREGEIAPRTHELIDPSLILTNEPTN